MKRKPKTLHVDHASYLYSIFNEDDIPKFGAGRRSVVALPPGRRWVTIVDWTTLDVARIAIDIWRGLNPVIVEGGYRPRRILAAMRERAAYFEHKSKTIRAAMKVVAAELKRTKK